PRRAAHRRYRYGRIADGSRSRNWTKRVAASRIVVAGCYTRSAATSDLGGSPMGLMDKIRGEFIDIIEWLDDSRDTIVWRFPRYDNEIKMGSQLIVRESQVAVFVNEGT